MVASGNAELGLIALSSVRRPGSAALGSIWELPADLYSPIRQDAVLLARAEDNPAARAFLDFLGSDFAIQLIERYGYGVESQPSKASQIFAGAPSGTFVARSGL